MCKDNISLIFIHSFRIFPKFASNDDPDDIVYISMVFSVLSIIISTLSMASQRTITKTSEFVSIEFDVKGQPIVSNLKKCKNRRRELQSQISILLGVNKNLVEITKPQQIQKGLRVNINLKVNNVKSIDMNIEQQIKSAKESGELAGILKASWKLNGVPSVSDVDYMKHDSKERQKNMVMISATSNSIKDTEDRKDTKDMNERQMQQNIMMSASVELTDMEMPPQPEGVFTPRGGDDQDTDKSDEESKGRDDAVVALGETTVTLGE